MRGNTNPNLLVRLLPISSLLHERHDNIFSGHERELLLQSLLYDFGIHYQSFGHILKGGEDNVGCEECLGESNAAVRPGRTNPLVFE
jgi:hypothetical protein